MGSKAVFEGLVFDELGRTLEVASVGGEAQYVIDDDGFLRHIDAASIDRQVLAVIQEQINASKDIVEEGMMRMLDNYDLFTKAAIDASIKNLDQVLDRGIPDDARMWLGMMGFRVVANVHGEVVKFDMPTTTIEDE
jgi:hypothetical protein